MTTENEVKTLQQLVDESAAINNNNTSAEVTTTSAAEETPTERELSPIEKEAKEMGWVPLDEFQGNKDNWAEAKEFVRVGKILKSRDEKNKKLEEELKELKSITETMLGSIKKTEQQAYDRALKDLEARLHRAKEIGDVDEALAINQQQIELQKQVQQLPELKQPNVSQTDDFKQFAAEESWVTGKDRMSKAMQTVATDISNEFVRLNPNASLKEELAHVKAEMRKEFPHYYASKEEPQAPTKQAVLSSSSTKPSSSSTKPSLDRLSKEERKVAEFLKNKGYDVTQYIEALTK